MTASTPSRALLAQEVSRLESELAAARARLAASPTDPATPPSPVSPPPGATPLALAPSTPAPHFLLLLSDSALPLSSFAFSAGLESYLAHHGYRSWSAAGAWPASRRLALLRPFLEASLDSVARAALPFALAAHAAPSALRDLDAALDAATPCTVARRASTAQGRALLGVWERCFAAAADSGGEAARALGAFAAEVKRAAPDDELAPQAHLAPVWGAACRAVGLGEREAAYVFLLNHVKAVVGAAVRLGVCGPFKNWEMLAAADVRGLVERALAAGSEVAWEEAAQCVPVLDLWMGRHEMLYSRIFNS